jgi:hypothetical protein
VSEARTESLAKIEKIAKEDANHVPQIHSFFADLAFLARDAPL